MMLNKLKRSITYKLWTTCPVFATKPVTQFNINRYFSSQMFPKPMGINAFKKCSSMKSTCRKYGNIAPWLLVVEFSLLSCIGTLMFQELINPRQPIPTNVQLIEHAIDKPLQQIKLNPIDSYLPIKSVEKGLRFAMQYDLCGVHIMSMPFTSGKTTAVKHVANDLVSKAKLCGALYIDMNVGDINTHNTFSAKIAEHLKVPCEKLYPLLNEVVLKHPENTEEHIKAPLVIIIDNVDNLIMTNNSFRYDLVSLATQSTNDKTFVLLLIFRNDNMAQLVCKWNGDTKIHRLEMGNSNTILQPTREELLIAATSQNLNLSPELMTTYSELCVTSKSIGFVAQTASIIRGYQNLKTPITNSDEMNNILKTSANIFADRWNEFKPVE